MSKLHDQVQDLQALLCDIHRNVDAVSRKMSGLTGYTSDTVRKLLDPRQSTSPYRSEDEKLEQIFKKYATAHENRTDSSGELSNLFLHKESVAPALKEFGCTLPRFAGDEWFHSLDINQDGFIDFHEFKRAVTEPSPLQQWAKSLPLDQLLAKALPTDDREDDPLRVVSRMSSKDIAALAQGFTEGLKELLEIHVKILEQAFQTLDRAKMTGCLPCLPKYSFQSMCCGNIKDFHKGLQERIGQAHVEFEKSMEAEHCQREGCCHRFTTSNTKLVTWPAKEWKIVLGTEICTEEERQGGRKIPDIDLLVHNHVSTKSKLIREEVIAVVLYTGPMFQVYNAILRRHPEDLYGVFQDKNMFTTTIFVLASAVQKISRVMKMPRGLVLYRGLGGSVQFPESFYKSDEHGCRGFVEWGFMSTTTNKQIALDYSGLRDNNPIPKVLVIRVGAVDRGACIRDFSQYESEIEYLWVPCSFVEQDGSKYFEVTPHGIVEMYPVKVNANLKASTTEELRDLKKKMHIAGFEYLVDEIHRDLHTIADTHDASKRLASERAKDETLHYSVEDFLEKITQQCKEVLTRHNDAESSDYAIDSKFRSLVLEMADIKVMALSKLLEWLENPSSPLRFRFNAQLRTVHRRRIAYLDHVLKECAPEKQKDACVKHCKITGLISDNVDEKNELGETRLMAAAAEGRSMWVLSSLVGAGSDVNDRRPDGVTAVWLAAQFGHDRCIKSLAELKAEVDIFADDGATPIYIAAQNGNVECIEVLVALGAKVDRVDNEGMSAVHQAAMNGHASCIKSLARHRADLMRTASTGTPLQLARARGHDACVETLELLISTHEAEASASLSAIKDKKIIVSSGDVSDVDGFLALVEYAKTGADVLFVMNYPAYIGVEEADTDSTYAEINAGLGFKYSAKDVFNKVSKPPSEYENFMGRYKDSTFNMRMKQAMTDCAFCMAKMLWSEVDIDPSVRGELLFCIGGLNSINPFSPSAVKNEILIYSKLIPLDCQALEPKEGRIYDLNGAQVDFSFARYSDIYLDFNGSMAFLDDGWLEKLNSLSFAKKIKGAFIMGGVKSDEPPLTMPSLPKILNRFSSATMNQLYHPENAARFFTFLAQNQEIPAFIVTNNTVSDFSKLLAPAKQPPAGGSFPGAIHQIEGLAPFLSANGLDGEFLVKLASVYYSSEYKPPRKAYDFYTAVAVRAALASEAAAPAAPAPRPPGGGARLYFSDRYGIALVSGRDGWVATREEYISHIDTDVGPGDSDFVRTKKDYFQREIAVMRTIEVLPSVAVAVLRFGQDPGTGRLLVLPGPPPAGASG